MKRPGSVLTPVELDRLVAYAATHPGSEITVNITAPPPRPDLATDPGGRLPGRTG